MNEAFEILGITGAIYLTIAIGYFSVKTGIFVRSEMQVFGRFTINFALPALLFNSLSRLALGEIFNWQYLITYAVGTLFMVILGLLWNLKIQGHKISYSSVLTMGMSCSNSGFVGFPVILMTLGSAVAGVTIALNMIVENLLIIPLLIALAESEDSSGKWYEAVKQSLKGVIKNPMIWGISLGLLVSAMEFQLPRHIGRFVDLFSASSSALSLFVIGGSLVGIKLDGVRSTVLQTSFGKLIVHPLIMLGLMLTVLPIADPNLRISLLLTASMPMFGIYTVLAQRFGHETISAASLLATTILSFFTLSICLWLLRHFQI